MRSIWLAALGLALSAAASADQVDFSLNNHSFAAKYSSARVVGGASFDADWFHHTDKGNVVGLGLKIDQLKGSTTASLGGKVVVISNDWKDASAIALGGAFNTGLAGEPKVRFGGHIWFAPSVTSFGDADGYTDLGLRVGYRALDRGEIYLGYRYVNVGYKNMRDLEIEDGLMVGMELSF